MGTQNVTYLPFFWLVLIAFVVSILTRRIRVPYSLALVITGLAIGIPRVFPQVHLDPTLLFTVFLPPLLFEGAIQLPFAGLRKDAVPITLFALAGTVLSAVIIGASTAWLLHIPLNVAFVFGALISATDPISVIAIFRRLGAGKRLTVIVEAESLFNDGVAAVLFVVAVAAVTSPGGTSIGGGLLLFARLFIGGLLVGGLIGSAASRIHYELDDHLIEITLTTVVAYGSYLLAETLHVSGVMAVVAAGLVIGNYGMPRTMSPGTRLAVSAVWEYAAFVVNSLVFLLIGIEVSYIRWSHNLALAACGIAAVLAGRAIVYPLSFLANRAGAEIPRSWSHILFWGGLRGALSMALALGLPETFPYRQIIVAATFAAVLFSLLAQGLTIGSLLTRLGLSRQSTAEPDAERRRLASEVVACQAALLELGRLRSSDAHPAWSIETLIRDYRERLSALEAEMEAAYPNYRALDVEQTTTARRRALEAEKSAYRDAENQGWLTQEDWRQIAARIDAELVALRED
jgi:CPA1 family monovalent cation:H+ antiporter